MSTMLAAVVAVRGDIEAREAPRPEPGPGRVLVRMQMASICGTDMHLTYDGWPLNDYPLPPGAPGHEGLGRVVDGGGTEFHPGELVLTVPNIWESRNFAEYQALPPHFLIRLPEDRDPAHLLMAQQLGTVIFAGRELPPLNGETVVVIGQGSAGLFHDYWMRRLGAGRIITIEPNRDRREAGLALDVDDAIDVTGEAAVDAVLSLTNGEGVDLVVDAVGGGETLAQAVKMARAEGHVHLFGLPSSNDLVEFDLAGYFLKRLNMTTTFGAQDEPELTAFREALDLIQRGEIDMAPFVTHIFPLSRVREAFELAHDPRDGALKVSLRIE
jgi:L-iditol 2-dehydrogenase